MRPHEVIAWMHAWRSLAPGLVAAIVWSLPLPWSTRQRCAITVLVGWLSDISFTAMVFNPICIEAATATGEHFPAVRFDNNTIGVAILCGWFVPLTVVIALSAMSAARLKVRRAARPSGTRPHPASPGTVRDARQVPPPAASS